MKGTVKFFNAKKGWGFITNDSDGKDVFVHHSQIQMEGFRKLDEFDVVEYEVGTTDTNGRNQAVNVKVIVSVMEETEKDMKECQEIVEKILNEFGIAIPMLSWAFMSKEELEDYYEELVEAKGKQIQNC